VAVKEGSILLKWPNNMLTRIEALPAMWRGKNQNSHRL
jgi:hypothetical protein